MKKLSVVLVVFTVLFSGYGCKKYSEGPGISLRSKKARIENTWVIESAVLGGIDSTSFYAVEGTEFTFGKDGSASGTQIRTNGVLFDTTIYEGYWELHEKDEVFALILTDKATAEIDTNWWWIRKLKNKEFWLEDEGNKGWDSQYLKLAKKK